MEKDQADEDSNVKSGKKKSKESRLSETEDVGSSVQEPKQDSPPDPRDRAGTQTPDEKKQKRKSFIFKFA